MPPGEIPSASSLARRISSSRLGLRPAGPRPASAYPESSAPAKNTSLGKDEEKLGGFFKEVPIRYKWALISLARKMTRQKTGRAG